MTPDLSHFTLYTYQAPKRFRPWRWLLILAALSLLLGGIPTI